MDLSLTTIKRLALSLMLVAPLTIGTFSSSPAAASASCDAVTLAAIDQVLGQIKTAQQHESADKFGYATSSNSNLASAYQKMSVLRSQVLNSTVPLFATTAPFGMLYAGGAYQVYLAAWDTTNLLLGARHFATLDAANLDPAARQAVEDIIVALNSVESLGTNGTHCYLSLAGV